MKMDLGDSGNDLVTCILVEAATSELATYRLLPMLVPLGGLRGTGRGLGGSTLS